MVLESVLGGVFGGLVPLFTKWLDNKEKAAERDHEFKMVSLQLQIDEARSRLKIDELHAQSAIDEVNAQWKALLEATTAQLELKSGIGWIDGLNSLLRPILTFWWCIVLYSVYKGIFIYVGLAEEVSLREMAGIVVTDFDGAVISAIIGFWFVNRQLANIRLKG